MISVIVPVYNSQDYLDRCVRSILNQSYRDFELLLVNDGSTDSSGIMCDKYAEEDSRVSVIHKLNGGVSSARNAGLDKATGEYITFVDSDDYVSETMLFDLHSCCADSHDMVAGSLKMISETGETDFCMDDSQSDAASLFEAYLSEKFPRICLNGPCVKLFRKDITDRYHIRFDSNMSLGEDTVFVTEYLSHCKKIKTTNKILYYYMRDNEASLYSRFRENWYEDSANAYKAVMSVAEKFNCSEESVNVYNTFRVRNLLATLILAVRTSSKKECISYMKALSSDEIFCDNMSALGKGSLMYITAGFIRLRFYGPVYFALKLRYRNR